MGDADCRQQCFCHVMYMHGTISVQKSILVPVWQVFEWIVIISIFNVAEINVLNHCICVPSIKITMWLQMSNY